MRWEGLIRPSRQIHDLGTRPAHSPLALLQTCRQIYSEAALIPLTTVNYIVESAAFEVFIGRMLTVQKAALKHLTLVMGVDGYCSAGFLKAWTFSTLVGLQHLTLIIGDRSADYHPLRGLEKLVLLPLRTVNILLSLASPYRTLLRRDIGPLEELQEAADALKSKLLRGREVHWIREGASAVSGMADGSVAAGRSAGRLNRVLDKKV